MHLEEDKIWEYLNMPNVTDKEIIEKHLAHCEKCRNRTAILSKEESMFRKLAYPTVTTDFTSNTVDRILQKEPVAADLWTKVFQSAFWSSTLFIAILILYKLHQKEVMIEIPLTDLTGSMINTIPIILLIIWVLIWSRTKTLSLL